MNPSYLNYPISLDLETAGIRPDAPIAAIGAVRFSPDGSPMDGPAHKFYLAVNLEGQTPPDASTFYWWMQQSDEARAAFCEGKGGATLSQALCRLRGWISGGQAGEAFRGELWVRGDRDSVWLESAHKACLLPLPYEYSKVRDQRTMVKFAEERGVQMPEREGTYHNALDDAVYQAACLQAVFKAYPPLSDY